MSFRRVFCQVAMRFRVLFASFPPAPSQQPISTSTCRESRNIIQRKFTMQNHSTHQHTHHSEHSHKHPHETSHEDHHLDQMPDEQSTREFALKKLKEILSTGITDKDILHQASNVATQIEQHLYSTNHGAHNQYKHKFRTISFNLQRNQKLRDQLLRAIITPEQLCNMTTFDMAPDSLKHEREKIEKEHTEGSIEDKDAYETMRYTVGQWIDKNEQLDIDQ